MKVTDKFFREWFGDIFFPLGFSFYKRVFYRKHGATIQSFSVDNHRGILQLGFQIFPSGYPLVEIVPENMRWLSANAFMDHLPIDYRADDDVIYHRAQWAVREMLVPLFQSATDAHTAYQALMRYFDLYIMPSGASRVGGAERSPSKELGMIEGMLNHISATQSDAKKAQKIHQQIPNVLERLARAMEKRRIEIISLEQVAARWYNPELIMFCIQMQDYDQAILFLKLRMEVIGESPEILEELRKSNASALYLPRSLNHEPDMLFGRNTMEIYRKLLAQDTAYFEELVSENERIWDVYLASLPKNRTSSGGKE